MINYFNFQIKDNYILNEDTYVSFFSVRTRNINILTNEEKVQEIKRFESIISELFSVVDIFKIHTYDAKENIQKNLEYIKNSKMNNIVKEKILAYFDNEKTNFETQKEFVFSFYTKSLEENIKTTSLIIDILKTNSYMPKLLQKQELISFLRQSISREFVDFDLKSFEDELIEEANNSKKYQKHLSKNEQNALDKFESIMQTKLVNQITPGYLRFNLRDINYSNFEQKLLYVKNYPSSTTTLAILSKCLISNVNSTLVFEKAKISSTIEEIKKSYNRRNSSKKQSEVENVEVEVEQKSILNNLVNLAENNSSIYNVSVFLSAYASNSDELRLTTERVKAQFQTLNITLENPTRQVEQCYRAFNPIFSNTYEKAKRVMLADSCSNLYPFDSSSYNDESGMFLGVSSTQSNIFVDFKKRTSNITSPTFTVIGVPGQGKSFLIKKIVAENYDASSGMHLYIIDPEGEYIQMLDILGGANLNVGGTDIIINPFEVRCFKLDEQNLLLDVVVDKSLEIKDEAEFDSHLQWLKEFFDIAIPELLAEDLDTLMILTNELYRKYGISEKTNFQTLSSSSYPTFTQLYNLMTSKMKENELGILNLETLKKLQIRLHSFLHGENKSFNGITNLPNSKVINFDCRQILTLTGSYKSATFFNLISYVWSNVMRNKINNIESMMITDEMQLLVNRDNVMLARYYNQFIKRARKYKLLFGTGYQELVDVLDETIKTITKPILTSSTFKFIFFPGKDGVDLTQETFNLKDGERNIISKSKQGNCLLLAGSQTYSLDIKEVGYEDILFGSAGGK